MNARVQERSREPRLDAGLIDVARIVLENAASLDGALLELGETVAPGLDTWRMSVRMIDWEHRDMVIVGVWARTATVLGVGSRLPWSQTAFPTILSTRRPVMEEGGPEENPNLLHQILTSEGMRSWVAIPLHQARMLTGTLTLYSIDLRAFARADLPFYVALGEHVEEPLLELVRRSGRFN